MLTLTRKRNEVVVIRNGPTTIRLTVGESRGDKLRLHFDAPTHVRIMREEIDNMEGEPWPEDLATDEVPF